MSPLSRLYAKLVFLLGDIHTVGRFPWVSWAVHGHLIDHDEILRALSLIQYGDIGLHRDRGYLSNCFIPGFMKHAWIHVEDDPAAPQIVEAVSEGVLLRNAIVPMHSDYTVILSPRGVSDEERKGACLKAKRLEGENYDVFFDFDIEAELQFYTGQDVEAAKREPDLWRKQAHTYAFSCTEVVSYAWWHKREELGLFRTKRMGKETIVADDFFRDTWQIKWMSASVTVETARAMGLHERGLAMVDAYRRAHP